MIFDARTESMIRADELLARDKAALQQAADDDDASPVEVVLQVLTPNMHWTITQELLLGPGRLLLQRSGQTIFQLAFDEVKIEQLK